MFDANITVRRADLNDAAVLAELSATTFTETFGHLYPKADLQTFLAESHSVETWMRKLADSRRAAWIAMMDEFTAVGFVAVGACKLPVENREPDAGEIHQLYVLAQYQHLGLGSRLMDVGLEWLHTQGRSPIYVGVWSENLGAQRFYDRYGFSKCGEYGFPVGSTVDHEFILKR